YALPEFLRNVYPGELNATDTGRIMSVYALTAAAIRPLVTWTMGKVGQRKVLTFALVMLILSMLLMARLVTPGTPYWYFAFPLVLYASQSRPLYLCRRGGLSIVRSPRQG